MARESLRRRENVPGPFYVDESCIDCDTCRWMAPGIFEEDGGKSAVRRQPGTEEEMLKAYQALVSCPTGSIGAAFPSPQGERTALREALGSFPLSVAENVYHCGYHAENTFGAASYLIRRDEGNVLVDCPRWAPSLVRTLDSWGGVRFLFLSHRDDVGDHQKYRDHFRCERILHRADADSGTGALERLWEGNSLRIDPDAEILHMPGHTQGSAVLLYKEKFLFSGDHLAWSERRGHLVAFRDACWYSWEEQLRSMRKLAARRFEWILPGHGRRFHGSMEECSRQMNLCLTWMETTGRVRKSVGA